MADRIEVPVLIVGGGPVGLSAAILLARFGIRSMLVERHPTTTDHPKARGLNVRTMELFRTWGVEQAVRKHSLPVGSRGFIWATRLSGEEVGRVELRDDAPSLSSPTTGCIVSQDAVENELRSAAESRAETNLRFSCELTAFEQDRSGVLATLTDRHTGASETIRAAYVIAADGASSPVRRALGIQMIGPDAMAHSINIYFRADLSKWVAHRHCVGFFFADPKLVGSALLSVNGTDRWISIARSEPGESFSNERCVATVREMVGDAGLNVEVINTAFWTMTAQVAATLRKDRVFLAGDAAHRFPPTGGFGMNTGIQDVHNLVWKLAAAIRGSASPALLDTYDSERRPVAQSNTDFSVTNAQRLGRIYASIVAADRQGITDGINDQRKHLDNLGQSLGFYYHSCAVVPDGTEPPPHSSEVYTPTARPGSRAPHVWLTRNAQRISTLDLFDTRFVLLAGPAGQRWRIAAQDVASRLRVPLDAFVLGDRGELEDRERRFLDLYGLNLGGAVLVRPDGHVAWRQNGRVTGERAELTAAIEMILGRTFLSS